MPAHAAGQVIVATGTDNQVTAVDPSTLGVGVPNVNANSLFGNNTGSTAPGASLTVADVLATLNLVNPVTVMMQSGIPFIRPPNGYMFNNGVFALGDTPAASATASFSGTSGSVTMTMSAVSLLGTSSDNGRVLTINDGGTLKRATITAFSSTTVATVTLSAALSGTGPFANADIWLTGAKPFWTTYPNAYIYMPADAIEAGSAAGWYYVVMNSPTTGTLYNDTYDNSGAGGSPTIPPSPTAFSTIGPGAYTAVTSGIAGPAVTIPGGSLGPNGALEIFQLASASNTTGSKKGDCLFGGRACFSFLMSNATNTYYSNIGSIRNAGAEDAQVNTRSASVSGDAQQSFSTGFGRERGPNNTAVDQIFQMNMSLGAAAGEWLVLEAFSLKLVKEA